MNYNYKIKEDGGISDKFIEMLPDSFWTNLAAAIVYRAALDYEDRLVSLYFAENRKEQENRYWSFIEVKKFFGSAWYYTLVDIEPSSILRKMKANAYERIKKKNSRKRYQTLWGRM